AVGAPGPRARRRRDDGRGLARHARGALVALPAHGGGRGVAAAAARGRAAPAGGAARGPIRAREGAQGVIRALLFDFDGLLLDTEGPSYRAWVEVYERHGHD